MRSLDFTDFEVATDGTLSDSEGRELADRKAAAILAWSAKYCNRLDLQKGTYTETFSPDGYASTFFLSALPLDASRAITVSINNASTDAYDTYTGTVRKNPHGALGQQTPAAFSQAWQPPVEVARG